MKPLVLCVFISSRDPEQIESALRVPLTMSTGRPRNWHGTLKSGTTEDRLRGPFLLYLL